jgi:class 3 adenylate cyclase
MKFGLKFKISVLVTLIVLVIMSAGAYLFGLRQEKTMRSEMRLRAAKIAQITGSLSLVQLPGGQAANWDFTRNFVDVIPQLDSNILYIMVVDREGAIQASSVNTALLRSLTDQEEVAELSRRLKEELRQGLVSEGGMGGGQLKLTLSNLGRLLPVEVELNPKGEPIGVVGIGFSLRDMERQILQARLIGVGLTLLFLAVGIGASVWLGTSITRPILALVQGMERVQEGDLTTEVKDSRRQEIRILGRTFNLRDEISVLGRAFNFMTAGLRERERVKETFKKYVSKDVAEKILSASETVVLTGERRVVTVLFADIRGFTSLAEKMEPEEVVEMLNEHFTLMIEIIFKHKGTLDKFIGDALMAVFGAPLSYGDDAYRAVQAAIEMQQASRDLNKRRVERLQPRLAMGVGIATGNVVSGNIGSEQRIEFTVIGDAVNTASRIQGKTAGGQILISQATYEEAKGRIKAEPREPLLVKGKREPVPVYEVLYT